MRILIDTDVLMDVALARPPHVESSAGILRWAEAGGAACIAWHSLSNCAYLLKNQGRGFLESLLEIVEVAPVGSREAVRALKFPMKDLEDALQASSALRWGADFIVTRNVKDYQGSPVPGIRPKDFLREVQESRSQHRLT